MDFRPLINTSLDLNINSFRHLEDHDPKGEDVRDNCDRNTTREQPGAEQEGVLTVEEFNRIRSENKKMTEMLTMYQDLWSRIKDMKCSAEGSATMRKRKFEDYQWDNLIRVYETSAKSDEEVYSRAQENTSAKVSRVYLQVDPADMSLIVKDGYQWRKYGQKVTRDNPSPRAYFKCSSAPSCPVKKKVQRSAENPSVLVAMYEGQHNHHCPTQTKTLLPNNSCPKPTSDIPNKPTTATMKSSAPDKGILGLVQPPGLPSLATKQPVRETGNEASTSSSMEIFPQLLVQKMASSLTSDPNFTAALAAAISGRILNQELPKN